jgi:hypothetical protein
LTKIDQWNDDTFTQISHRGMRVMQYFSACYRGILTLFQVVTFALFLGMTAPHAVHHLFQEPSTAAEECTLFTASSKNSSLTSQQVELGNRLYLEGDLGLISSPDLQPQRLIADHSGRSPPPLLA